MLKRISPFISSRWFEPKAFPQLGDDVEECACLKPHRGTGSYQQFEEGYQHGDNHISTQREKLLIANPN